MGILDIIRKTGIQPTLSRTADGQAANPLHRSQAVGQRQIDELIGLCKGVLFDGAVSQNEADGLLNWLEANKAAASVWPGNALYARLHRALADGHLDGDEEKDLLAIIMQTVAPTPKPNVPANQSTALPLDDPPPQIVFEARTFCFTGQFASGSRQWCEQQVLARGGIPKSSITKKLHYLVIGEIGSRDWLHSTHGRKIETAMTLKQDGADLLVIGERHWHSSISG
jgi:NAD-dependent DNA ligase